MYQSKRKKLTPDFFSLPEDSQNHVLTFLSSQELGIVSLTCKEFHECTLAECIWKEKIEKSFGKIKLDANLTAKENYQAILKIYYPAAKKFYELLMTLKKKIESNDSDWTDWSAWSLIHPFDYKNPEAFSSVPNMFDYVFYTEITKIKQTCKMDLFANYLLKFFPGIANFEIVSRHDGTYWTIVHIAAIFCEKELLSEILKVSRDFVNARDFCNHTPIIATFRWLSDYGRDKLKDVGKKILDDNYKQLPDIISILLDHGAEATCILKDNNLSYLYYWKRNSPFLRQLPYLQDMLETIWITLTTQAFKKERQDLSHEYLAIDFKDFLIEFKNQVYSNNQNYTASQWIKILLAIMRSKFRDIQKNYNKTLFINIFIELFPQIAELLFDIKKLDQFGKIDNINPESARFIGPTFIHICSALGELELVQGLLKKSNYQINTECYSLNALCFSIFYSPCMAHPDQLMDIKFWQGLSDLAEILISHGLNLDFMKKQDGEWLQKLFLVSVKHLSEENQQLAKKYFNETVQLTLTTAYNKQNNDDLIAEDLIVSYRSL